MSFLEIWTSGFLVIMCFLTVLWIISVYIKNASIVDCFWGLGFVILAYFYQSQTKAFELAHWLLVVLVTVWGLRLSIHLIVRNSGKGEDFRYQEFRRKFGPKRYWWFSFFRQVNRLTARRAPSRTSQLWRPLAAISVLTP